MDYDKHINEFADLVFEYCAWSENKKDKESDMFYLQVLLSKLYSWGIQLPECEIKDDNFSEEEPSIRHTEVIGFFKSVPYQYYSKVFSAETVPSEQPVTGDLIDDLADIYKDLKGGLWYFEKGETVEAVFHWRTTLGFHWARHIMGAMYALYCFEQ